MELGFVRPDDLVVALGKLLRREAAEVRETLLIRVDGTLGRLFIDGIEPAESAPAIVNRVVLDDCFFDGFVGAGEADRVAVEDGELLALSDGLGRAVRNCVLRVVERVGDVRRARVVKERAWVGARGQTLPASKRERGRSCAPIPSATAMLPSRPHVKT